MYFPGDPLFPFDPIFNGIPDEKARERLIARFDLETTQPEWALGYHSTSSCAAARRPPWRSRMSTDRTRPEGITPVADGGALLPLRAHPRHRLSARAGLGRRPCRRPWHARERIVLTGRIIDGAGEPVPDAMLEIWQADTDGRYAHPGDGRARQSNSFMGFGRSDTRADGTYRFETVKPGPVPGPGGPRAGAAYPRRGVRAGHAEAALHPLLFRDEATANAADPILALVPEARRGTLIAKRHGDTYTLDIRLQGEGETVFFAV